MPSYTQSLWHIVFSTKYRAPVLVAEHRREFLMYLNGTLKSHRCFVYRINAVEDHVHILVGLPPDLAVASLVRDVKVATSKWLKDSGRFPGFIGWQRKYGAFTVSWRERDVVIEYIKNQEEHHRGTDFMTEFRGLLRENGMEYDERDEERSSE